MQNSILWADVAHAINVGGHGDDRSPKGETLRGVRFRNIDVLNVDEDDDNYRGVMAVCAGDKNRVEDVSFEDPGGRLRRGPADRHPCYFQ